MSVTQSNVYGFMAPAAIALSAAGIWFGALCAISLQVSSRPAKRCFPDCVEFTKAAAERGGTLVLKDLRGRVAYNISTAHR